MPNAVSPDRAPDRIMLNAIAQRRAGVQAALAPSVQDAITKAARETGVDFSYLMAQARLESGFNPLARSATSSAEGLYQFTQNTWAQTLAKHGDALNAEGFGPEGLGIPGGASAIAQALSDPTQRAGLMALRRDPQISALMAAELAGDNQQALTTTLGRSPDASELYLAHFLGSDGASKYLAALATDPTQSAAALFPKAAASNHALFFDETGSARSVGAMMALVRGRMKTSIDDNASLSTGNTVFAENTQAGGPLAREFAAASAASNTTSTSMADTLATAFGLDRTQGNDAGATEAAPAFVRAAYGQLQQLGF